MVLSLDEYKEVYDEIDAKTFKRFSVKAERLLDSWTTTVDGVRKLHDYFPTEEIDVNAVKMCIAELINCYYQLQTYQNEQQEASGFEKAENGYKPKAISSLSAGSESVSFSSEQVTSWASEVSKSKDAELAFFSGLVRDWLTGVKDRNGVNLLYTGRYPRCRN